ENIPLTPLTNLNTVKKDIYDAEFDYDIEYILPQAISETPPENFLVDVIKQEPNDIEITVEDRFNNDSYLNDDSYSDNEVLTIDFDKLKELENDQINVKKKKSTIKSEEVGNQSILKYQSKAIITDLNVDLTDMKKHCSKVVLSEKEIEELLERDKAIHKVMPFKCKVCKKAYRRSIDLRRHEVFNHMESPPSKCTECDVTISSWQALRKHWRRHNAYYACVACGWLSHSRAALTKHLSRSHARAYACRDCDITCSTLREFSNHYKESHERIICDHCNKSFVKKKTLEIHIKRHHTPATCIECNRTYAHYHVLENHYRMQHPHLTKSSHLSVELAYCVECDKQFPTVYKYKRHLATAAKHTPPKRVRVPCPECGKVFARKIRMTNHYKSVHVNTTKHRCDICNKTFCSAFSARTHRQHVHEKIPMPKNKMCDICGRGFSTNRILANHRRTHTGERPYKCAHCPATFAQHTAMSTHARTQHLRRRPENENS
ncbi:zinc finger protein 665-like, partial [Ostrinia furnacalis]|uniref:zinc finger protein 665-like n=1 Tax=Ostrinia furnacalis TaxID=93504 RepID=UPI00103F93BC